MPAFKDGKTWRAVFYYRDYTGTNIQTTKRGFATKREALDYEREFIMKATFNNRMTFQSLYELYMEDMAHRLRKHTMMTKKKIIEDKILPFFSKLKLDSITPVKVRQWQNTLISGVSIKNTPYSPTYLKTINNQLTAIFNYAVKYHNMKENPCHKAGSMGKKKAEEMIIWTPEEFEKFSQFIKNKMPNYVGFNILFWTGIRIGELLALTLKDIDLRNKTISISKSYQRLEGEDVITAPKTTKSKRVVTIPDSVVELLERYLKMLYKPSKTMRLFPYTKHLFENDLRIYSEKAGLKKIRIHDLRHSHASYLFNNGVDILTIAKRLGHENIETTLGIYAHTYTSADEKLLKILNKK